MRKEGVDERRAGAFGKGDDTGGKKSRLQGYKSEIRIDDMLLFEGEEGRFEVTGTGNEVVRQIARDADAELIEILS